MKKRIGMIAGLMCALCLLCACQKDTKAVLTESSEAAEESAEALQSSDEEGDTVSTESVGEETSDGTMCVFICGAVINPGVYEVSAGSRICDVLEAAGGFSEDAGTDYLNLAEPVSDGQKVYVPSEDELSEELLLEEDATVSEESSGKVNINTASKEMLVTLPGIGDSKAESIIAYRTEHGGFSSIEEIMEISGIKESVFSKIKELITVG